MKFTEAGNLRLNEERLFLLGEGVCSKDTWGFARGAHWVTSVPTKGYGRAIPDTNRRSLFIVSNNPLDISTRISEAMQGLAFGYPETSWRRVTLPGVTDT